MIWSPELAYVVGLLATDGNLSSDGRHLSIHSKDRELLEAVKQVLGLANRITLDRLPSGGDILRLQWGDRLFYDWLLGIGLTAAKSLTLQPLAVPDAYFVDFFRGWIDRDGSVIAYTDRYHVPKSPRYVYERLYVSLVSASRPFIEWIGRTIFRLLGTQGTIHIRSKPHRNSLHVLRFAKHDSIRIGRWMYYTPNVPCLARKRLKAERFLSDDHRVS
jgi:hypothetical protein